MSTKSSQAGKLDSQLREPKLKGKSVVFVGDLGRYNAVRYFFAAVLQEGGTVIEEIGKETPDYLIVGRGRGGATPGQATALLKRHPNVQLLDCTAFCQLVLPETQELLESIKSGAIREPLEGISHENGWGLLEVLCEVLGTTIDFSGQSFRGMDLSGAKLGHATINGADFSECSLYSAHLPAVRDARFDGSNLKYAHLAGAERCSFRGADLSESWFYDVHAWGASTRYIDCDFSDAKITQGQGARVNASGCLFVNAGLQDAEFEESNLSGADLSGADLRGATLWKAELSEARLNDTKFFQAYLSEVSLVNADLSNADMRQAILTGADLSGAKVDGADFEGATLFSLKAENLDVSKARNFEEQTKRLPGPKMAELVNALKSSKTFYSSVEIDLGEGERVHLMLNGGQNQGAVNSYFFRANDVQGRFAHYRGSTVEEQMIDAAIRWNRGGIKLDTVNAKASVCPLKSKDLFELAKLAWSEACGISAAEVEARYKFDVAAREKLRKTLLDELKGGPEGIKKWNQRGLSECIRVNPLSKTDFSGCNMTGVTLVQLELQKSKFNGAILANATIKACDLSHASFANADLRDAKFSETQLGDVDFSGANLSNVVFSFICFRSANFSGAILDGAVFEDCDLDEKTQLPDGFVPAKMSWRGVELPAVASDKQTRERKTGTLTFEEFFDELSAMNLTQKLKKATAMLKAERFELFADREDDSLVGIIRSQTNDDLVYCCRLSSDGVFACCTQNLRPCGGLQGALCKHLLVLIVGLVKSNQLEPSVVLDWIDKSKKNKPVLDKETTSELFLKYKGAEAGEIDWRPTETIPEDYYQL